MYGESHSVTFLRYDTTETWGGSTIEGKLAAHHRDGVYLYTDVMLKCTAPCIMTASWSFFVCWSLPRLKPCDIDVDDT